MPKSSLNTVSHNERNRRIGAYENRRNDHGHSRSRARMQVRAARQAAHIPAPFTQTELDESAAAQQARLHGSAISAVPHRRGNQPRGLASSILASLIFLSLINGVGGTQPSDTNADSPQDNQGSDNQEIENQEIENNEQAANADIFDPDPTASHDTGSTQHVLHAHSIVAASQYLTQSSPQNTERRVQTQMVFTRPECRDRVLSRILASDVAASSGASAHLEGQDQTTERQNPQPTSAQTNPSYQKQTDEKMYNNKLKWTSQSPSANAAIAELNLAEFSSAVGNAAINQDGCIKSLAVESVPLPSVKKTIREQAKKRYFAQQFEPDQSDKVCQAKTTDAASVTGITGSTIARIPEVECRTKFTLYSEPTVSQLQGLTGRLSQALCVKRVAIISSGIDGNDVNNHVRSTTTFDDTNPHTQNDHITSAVSHEGAIPSSDASNNMATDFVRAALRRCPETQFQDVRAASLVYNGEDLPSSSVMSAQAVTQALDSLFTQEGGIPESVVLLDNHEIAGYYPDITATAAIVKDLNLRGVRVFAYESSRGSWLSRVPGVTATSSISATLAKKTVPQPSPPRDPSEAATPEAETTTEAIAASSVTTTETFSASVTEATVTEATVTEATVTEALMTEDHTRSHLENTAAKCQLRNIKHGPKAAANWANVELNSVLRTHIAVDQLANTPIMSSAILNKMQGYYQIVLERLQRIEATSCNIKSPQSIEEKVALESFLSIEKSVRDYLNKINTAIEQAKHQLISLEKVKQRPIYACRQNTANQSAMSVNREIKEKLGVFTQSITNIKSLIQSENPLRSSTYDDILLIQSMVDHVLTQVEEAACEVKKPITEQEKTANITMNENLHRIRSHVLEIDALVIQASERLAPETHAHGTGDRHQGEANADSTYKMLALLAIGLSSLGLTLFCCNKKKTKQQRSFEQEEDIPLQDQNSQDIA